MIDALTAVELEDYADRATNTLSGGQKQRVAIAGALAQNPKVAAMVSVVVITRTCMLVRPVLLTKQALFVQVLLLDELTTFLDDEGQRSVIKAVKSAVDGPRKVTALWVTHRMEELAWADGASFMEDGRIKVSGRPRKVAKLVKGS